MGEWCVLRPAAVLRVGKPDCAETIRGGGRWGDICVRVLCGADDLGYFPEQWTVAGGTVVSIRGIGFGADRLACRFGAISVTGANALLSTSSMVACVSPKAGEEGAVALEVSLNGGVDYTASGKRYVYQSSATVESLRPSSVVAGAANQVITVVGRYFERTEGLSCRMGANATVSAVYASSSMVKCMAPVRGAGTVRVSVSNNGVDAGLSSRQLTFEAGRGISSVTPSKASVRGGTTVTVSTYGSMRGEGDTVSCHFGTVVVAGEVRGDSSVVCVSPKTRSRSTVELRVSEGSSGALLMGSLTFEYLDELRITGVRPSIGILGRGTSVSVMLSGGISGASGLQCRFGTQVVTGDGVRMMSSSMVTCLAPVLGEAEEVTVDVSANGGADFTNSGVEFMFEAAATVETLVPSHGAGGATGQTVTVVGQHFTRTGDLSCWFGVNGTVSGRYMSSNDCDVCCAIPGSRHRGCGGEQQRRGCRRRTSGLHVRGDSERCVCGTLQWTKGGGDDCDSDGEQLGRGGDSHGVHIWSTDRVGDRAECFNCGVHSACECIGRGYRELEAGWLAVGRWVDL